MTWLASTGAAVPTLALLNSAGLICPFRSASICVKRAWACLVAAASAMRRWCASSSVFDKDPSLLASIDANSPSILVMKLDRSSDGGPALAGCGELDLACFGKGAC